MKLKSIYRENIYNIDEVSKLRNFIEEENNCNVNMKITDFKEDNLLINYMFSTNLLTFLQNKLKDEVYFVNSFVIQKNNRTFRKEKYHKDSGKIHQSNILSKKKNLYGKVGIPLQDNIKGEGGGIDYLRPMILDNFSDKNLIINKIRAIYYILQDKFIDTQLYSKAGDAIYFSAMLSHRTTLTDKNMLNSIKDKYVIYYQLTNLNTIIDVLKITRNNSKVSAQDIEEDIIIKNFNDNKIKILNDNISKEVGHYIGL
ncbi:hypothetical protein OAJ09_00885 [Candidatus Pelagibacter sp.]|nr:hypothetical protein [Candidatus Pelagibacter sp.]